MVALESVWTNMLSQGTEGSKFKMVECIEHVYAFLHVPELKRAMARGVSIEVILVNEPKTDIEKIMVQEIGEFANLNRNPTYEERVIATLDYNMQKAYAEGGLEAAAKHAHDYMRTDGKKFPYSECLTLAKAMEETLHLKS